MDSDLFLQQLHGLSLEDGRAYIKAHAAELEDHAAFGNLLADEALAQLYTPFVSLKLAELLIFFGEYVSHASSHALGLKAKGDVLMMIGHHQAAMECLDAAGDEFLGLGDEGNWARSRISWIVSCAWLGRVEEALQEAALARDVFLRLGEHYWVCAIDHNTALIYDYVGRYQDALKLYESMRAIYPTLTDQNEISIKQRIALAEMNQSVHLALLGNFEQAYHLQLQALASFIALKEMSLVIYSEIHLADFDYTQGYYGSALRRYYQALDSLMQSNLDDPLLVAELKLWIASCLVKLNRPQEACPLADEAVELYRQSGISLITGVALREYAITLLASGKSKEALSALDEAWTIFERGGFDPYASATKLQQAELRLRMGDVFEAYNQARLIKDYFDAQGLVARSVRASLVMVDALIQLAQQTNMHEKQEQQSTFLQEAVLLCKQAALQAYQHNLQEEVYKSHYLLGRLFALQGNFKKAARHIGAAIAQIERILDNLVYDLSPSFLHTTWAIYEDMIALCLHQGQVERAFGYLEQARSMALQQYLNKSNSVQGAIGEKQYGTPSTVSKVNSAVMLRMQQELKNWQEQYRDYNVILGDIDTSLSPHLDREVIQTELKRCEEKISELFERLHLHQLDVSLESHTKKPAKHNRKQVDNVQLRQQLVHNQLLLTYFLYKGKLVIF